MEGKIIFALLGKVQSSRSYMCIFTSLSSSTFRIHSDNIEFYYISIDFFLCSIFFLQKDVVSYCKF